MEESGRLARSHHGLPLPRVRQGAGPRGWARSRCRTRTSTLPHFGGGGRFGRGEAATAKSNSFGLGLAHLVGAATFGVAVCNAARLADDALAERRAALRRVDLLLDGRDVDFEFVEDAADVVDDRVDALDGAAFSNDDVARGQGQVVDQLPHVHLVNIHHVVYVKDGGRHFGGVDAGRRGLQQNPARRLGHPPPSGEDDGGRQQRAHGIGVRRKGRLALKPVHQSGAQH
mmetsp:Transcript_4123/g.10402  ORF Transcript_4123/g.10402 Transcript_4123/m.10402 type:complete len:229 (-) Transcript_4123:339-1025(-)